MVQITASALSAATPDRILCHYINTSDRLQIVRILNPTTPPVQGRPVQGIVFAKQCYLFEADPSAILEVHTSTPTSIPVKRIPCIQLLVKSSAHPSALASGESGATSPTVD